MLTVTPFHIAQYMRCPRRIHNTWDILPGTSHLHRVITNIIQTIHLYHCRKERIPPWKHVSGWVNKHATDAMALMDPHTIYNEAKNILSLVHQWYQDYYLQEFCDPCIPNVPILLDIGRDTTYSDRIAMVGVGSKVKLFDFKACSNLQAINKSTIWDDPIVHARLWGFVKASGFMPDEYVTVWISSNSIKALNIFVSKGTIEKAETIISHVVNGIRQRAFYPSFSEQCSGCQFNTSCHF